MFRWIFSGERQFLRRQAAQKARRHVFFVAVSVVLENGAVAKGHIKNMSTEGAFVITGDRPFGLVVGEEGDLGLDLPPGSEGSEYRFPCEITRITQEGVAVRFLMEPKGNLYHDDISAH